MWLYTWHWLRHAESHMIRMRPTDVAVGAPRPAATSSWGCWAKQSPYCFPDKWTDCSGFINRKQDFRIFLAQIVVSSAQSEDFTQKMVSPAKRRRFIGEKCYCGGKIVFESGSGSGWTWDCQRMGFAEGISGIPVVLSKIILLSLVI